jgi:hypothetical protein
VSNPISSRRSSGIPQGSPRLLKVATRFATGVRSENKDATSRKLPAYCRCVDTFDDTTLLELFNWDGECLRPGQELLRGGGKSPGVIPAMYFAPAECAQKT